MNDNKFPIKYAVLELKETGGYYCSYQDIVRGYIVSKCWVIESGIKYFPNGESKIFHQVIFPYKDLSDFKISLRNNSEEIMDKKIIPTCYASFNPYVYDTVSDIFDCYEDAKVIANEKNEEMKRQLVSEINYSVSNSKLKETLDEMRKDFDEQLDICELFEELSLSNTENMEITDNIETFKNHQLSKKKDNPTL